MQKITKFFVRLVQNILPDAYILAVLLTFVVFGAGVVVMGKSPFDMISLWGNGYPSLFVFAMQMVLVLLTGYVLALTPVMEKVVDKLVAIPKTPKSAMGLTAIVGLVSCYFNWGFGMVIGAIVAKAMGRKIKGIHFPLLVAASYGGELVRGPSSSIPLVSATPGNFMTELGIDIVPVTETLYSPWNIILTILIAAALFTYYCTVKAPDDEIIEYKEPLEEAVIAKKEKSAMTFAERLENTYILNILIALFPLTYLVVNFNKLGFNLNLNLVILIFMTLGLLFHSTPMQYLQAVARAITATKGIIVQFPLYAGISSMMVGSGMVESLSLWFVNIATPTTFPMITFLAAGLVNIFVPSGGGQWAIQGPVMMKAASAMGASIPQTVMAFAWGDGWTNQIQPFWALPLLGVVGLNARDIMGYCVIWTIVSGIIICGVFTILTFI